MKPSTRSRHARAWLLLPFLALAALPAQAATVCVDSAAEFLAALADATEEEQTINVVSGTYAFTANPNANQDSLQHDVQITGGWNANCSGRQPDPRVTEFTGSTAQFQILSEESIRIDSIAFVDIGEIYLGARDNTISLERVWFENVRIQENPFEDEPDDAVNLSGGTVQLLQVVAIDNRAGGCALRIIPYRLKQATVAFSLFAGNDSHGLCVARRMSNPIGGYTDDWSLFVQNSIFWDNAQDDLVTRVSPDITLRNNLYQSRDASPEPDTLPQQTLSVDPQFQNAAGHDFRLQPSSPAINTGRVGSLFVMPGEDLDGGPRFIGSAPDRGPFESTSSESTFQVTNTLDTLDPVVTGSLRWAIEQANATPGLDRIRFALPSCPRLIELNAPLPDITESVFIDGYSQAGSERNQTTFGFAPTLCVGLRDTSLALDHALRIPAGAADDTFLWVSGLAFGGFDVAAVRIAAGSNSWIFGNQFGGSLGDTALGNNAVNVRLGGTSHDNLIGGLETSQRNLVASAYSAGVELLDNSGGDDGYANTVRNNLIGLQSNGRDAAPNAIGIRVRSLRNEIVDNFISGNQNEGILLEGPLAFRNVIRDNAIGFKTFAFCLPPCTPDYALGNGAAGIRLVGDGLDNEILDNRISHNGGPGVRLEDGRGSFVWANSIGANDGLGIDLGAAGINPEYNTGLAVTATFANRGINAPTLTEATGDGTGGRVEGEVSGRNGLHRVQLFRNASCDASGRGEGATLVDADTVTISNAGVGANGNATFVIPLPVNANFTGTTLTATLSDGEDNTSEFSACRAYETVPCREILKDGFEDTPAPPRCTPL